MRTLTIAGAAYAAWSLYQQSKTGPQRHKHRLPVETWENEGGALLHSGASESRDSGTSGNRAPPAASW